MEQSGSYNNQVNGSYNNLIVNYYGIRNKEKDLTKYSDKVYKYVSRKVRIILYLLGIFPSLLLVWIMGINGTLFNDYIVFIYIWMGILFGIFLMLPFLSDRFSVRFHPKDGFIIIGDEKIYFEDIGEVVRYSDGVLRISFREDDRDIFLTISNRGSRYIYRCFENIGRG